MTMYEFVKIHRITMTSDRIDSNPHMASPREMDHWKCKLSRTWGARTDPEAAPVRTYATRKNRMTVPFSMGFGHNGKAPEAADVLSCLASDASSVSQSDIEEWCRDMGYDTDSRKAERTYKICQKQAGRLKRFLGDDLYDTLLYHTEQL